MTTARSALVKVAEYQGAGWVAAGGPALIGLDPFHLHELKSRVITALPGSGGINAKSTGSRSQVDGRGCLSL